MTGMVVKVAMGRVVKAKIQTIPLLIVIVTLVAQNLLQAATLITLMTKAINLDLVDPTLKMRKMSVSKITIVQIKKIINLVPVMMLKVI